MCLASVQVVERIKSFYVHRDVSLPSDHAPIGIRIKVPRIDIDYLYRNACNLGSHVYSPNQHEHELVVQTPIKYCSIDVEVFCNRVNGFDLSIYDGNNDVADLVANLPDDSYECVRKV